MFNYKYCNELVDGSLWKRASSIIINNNFGETPVVIFDEHLVAELGGETLSKPAGNLIVPINEGTFAEPIQILNSDGEETGTEVTIGQIAIMLFSAYVHFSNKRDQEVTEGHESSPVEIFNQIPGAHGQQE